MTESPYIAGSEDRSPRFPQSETSEQPDDLAENRDRASGWIDDDRRHRLILGLEHDARAVAHEALHRRLALAARLRLDHRDDDVVRLRGVLPPDEHEIAVADMGLDHRLAPDAEREDVLAAPGQRRRGDRHLAFAILLGQERRARGDPAEDRYGVMRPPRPGHVGKRQSPRGSPHARAPLQLAFALERAQVIERGPRGDPEPLAELAHGRRHAVLGLEAAHEAQHFPLPARQLTHPLSLRGRQYYSTGVD